MQASIFDLSYKQNIKQNEPLAARMRPTTLEEFYGQPQVVGKGKLLSRLIQTDHLTSAIFYGPPGTGKTTLANIIANQTKADFQILNAVTSGKKEIEKTIQQARQNIVLYNRKTILFIDEIHRFNKSQQDALLPSVEKGEIILIGATTENPYFEINSALISRSTIFKFLPLEKEDIKKAIDHAIIDQDKGLGMMHVEITEDAKDHFAEMSNGDVRKALNALELAVLSTDKGSDGKIHIDINTAQECIQKKALNYDKNGNAHYDTISAFIKSIRGSDPDAAVFWMAKMLDSGEDPKFIARRMIISASEDVGNAEPLALVVAVSAAQALDRVGLPEAQINLSQAATFLASAPKSNASNVAIQKANHAVRYESDGQVPLHLRDTHYKGSQELNNGAVYKFPHDYPNHYVAQQYLPEDLCGKSFYLPTENGFEEKIKHRLEKLKNNN
jgi:putative ATPase